MILLKSLEPISCCRNDEENLLEYVGIGMTQAIIFAEGPQNKVIQIPVGSRVTYILKEYCGDTVLTMLIVGYNQGNDVYQYTSSVCCGISRAATNWGLEGYDNIKEVEA